MSIKVVGIDLAKHYFQVCVLSNENKAFRRGAPISRKYTHCYGGMWKL